MWRLLAQIQQTDINLPNKGGLSAHTIANVLRVVFGVAGGVALLVVTIAALQFVVSQGDPQGVTKARNTIIYALVGLFICISAFSIVSFVITKL